MERVNLPTGFNYAGNVMLFRRRPTWFDLTWTPLGSERAVAWAGASEAALFASLPAAIAALGP